MTHQSATDADADLGRERSLASLKRFASRLGRGRMFSRRLPADLGGCRFPASLEGGAKFLRWRPDHFDPVLTRFAKMAVRRGSVVWDVGANVGLFSFAAAGLSGHGGAVVAIEPDCWLAENLIRASRWNPSAAEVTVIPAAIADTVGLSTFFIANSNRATNYLEVSGGSSVTGGIRERRLVPTLTLDCLSSSLPMPDVLKIDVEGSEQLVLAGASQVLETRPIILIETGAKTRDAIHGVLASFGYTYIDAATGRQCERPVFNTIATSK